MEEGAIGAFPDQARIRRIFRLRRELRRFENIAGQMEEMAAKLANTEQPAIDPRARPWFRDVYDHAHRATTRARGLNETLGYILDVAGLLEQSRTGAITRQLAAWAAILAVPTAIAGIYGMNFDFMPELTLALRLFRRARRDRADSARCCTRGSGGSAGCSDVPRHAQGERVECDEHPLCVSLSKLSPRVLGAAALRPRRRSASGRARRGTGRRRCRRRWSAPWPPGRCCAAGRRWSSGRRRRAPG